MHRATAPVDGLQDLRERRRVHLLWGLYTCLGQAFDIIPLLLPDPFVVSRSGSWCSVGSVFSGCFSRKGCNFGCKFAVIVDRGQLTHSSGTSEVGGASVDVSAGRRTLFRLLRCLGLSFACFRIRSAPWDLLTLVLCLGVVVVSGAF